jgi:hypothetical protein
MLKLEDAVMFMEVNLEGLEVISGNIEDYLSSRARSIFDENSIDFLQILSKAIIDDPASKNFPDLLSIGFAIRPTNIHSFFEKFDSGTFRIGRGNVFHITPSNVPLNFVYSYVFGLLAGNANLVRLSSRNFPQVDRFIQLLNAILTDKKFEWIRQSTCFVRYSHSRAITTYFSNTCDARIIWGGDTTIKEIRLSPIPVRSIEVSFPDRYSITLLKASSILGLNQKELDGVGSKFFTDSYLFDQQGCSSPKLICWYGTENEIEMARGIFWPLIRTLATSRYDLQAKNAIDKFVDVCLLAASGISIQSISMPDSYLAQIQVNIDSEAIGEFQGQFGTFVECEFTDWSDFQRIVSKNFQTMTYFGFEVDTLREVLAGLPTSGIDRVVPIGQAFDITIEWDGINFVETLSRIVEFR